MQFALYHHVGSGNKGCEALVDSTGAMLSRVFPGTDIALYSQRPDEDAASRFDFISGIIPVSARPNGRLPVWERVYLKSLRLRSAHAADMHYFSKSIRTLPLDERVYLSIGGDTYCYGENSFMHAFNAELKRRGRTTILWGCSLDESSFTPDNADDLRTYDAIFARESGTYTLLREKGFTKNVFLHPDPAFTLPAEELPLPEGFAVGNTIGINASPLVFKYENGDQKGVAMQAYEHLIESILHNTDCSVLLTPHVFWSFSDDRSILSILYEKYRDSGRVLMLEREYSARELKGFIRRCRAFIGARTHSTIAAYSSCVPTLVLGYSVKSVNIALDLFGKTDGFVVPVDELEDADGLSRAFDRLLQTEQLHRQILSERVPDYICKASEAAQTLRDFLREC